MISRIRAGLTCSALVVSAVVATTTPAGAAHNGLIADWQMNEPSNATTMTDSSGHGLTGDLRGLSVIRNGSYYDFNENDRPNTTLAPDHIVQVPHNNALNPGIGTYAVEVRYRTDRPYGNLIQKGQAGAGNRGGYWKFQLPQGEVSCLFRGPSGTNAVRYQDYGDYNRDGRPDGRLDNDQWHTVRCERFRDGRGEGVRMTVDGNYVGINRGTTGSIANSEPVYIGGKGYCDQVNITCDYFGGEIDYARISRP